MFVILNKNLKFAKIITKIIIKFCNIKNYKLKRMRIISNSIYHILTTLVNLKDIKIDFFC